MQHTYCCTLIRHIHSRHYIFLCLFFASVLGLQAQITEEQDSLSHSHSLQQRSRQSDSVPLYKQQALFPNGRLEVGVLVMGTKYFGEYTDNSTGIDFGVTTRYFFPFLPELGVGARMMVGKLQYQRRYKERFGDDFARQFPPADFPDARSTSVSRHTKVTTGELFLALNLFPRQRLNYYLFAGGGILSFQAQDIVNDPLNGKGEKLHYPAFKDESEFDFHAVGGLGIDYYITRNFSLGLQGVYHKLHTDILDGYAQKRNDTTGTNPDGYAEFGFKLSYYLFDDDDFDNDGISNEEEIALGTNPYKADTDGDGVNDYDEVRNYHSNPLNTDTDHDGVSDADETQKYHTDPFKEDTDGDGISDLDEIQIYKTNPREADTDSDGVPDKEEIERGSDPLKGDTDSDGIPDSEDKCPSVFGYVENQGCPLLPTKPETQIIHDTVQVIKEVKPIEQGQSYTPYGINFKRGKADIEPESEIILDDVAKWLLDNKTIKVEIRGHTDAEGAEEGNMTLSRHRAESVRDYLILQGVDPLRLSAKGYGESWPIDDNSSLKGRARNRRIEFYVKEK